ncbi:MAG: site-specific DNA-methyltransferase [Phycisphaerales bacterium]|nr:site-specific DNA-methyltransferase [Phycisphaerales bacterium]
MPGNLEKLRGLLAELFQLDQADLDFGIYRIMNAKRDEITRFLDQDLLPQVRRVLEERTQTERDAVQAELTQAIAQARTLGADPEGIPRVRELRERIARAGDIPALENEVFSHLFSFFRRYYDEGDFLSLRRYKEGVYAIPYEGEEVKLHWANADQYYIKTAEHFRDYTFKLPNGRRVHFKLVEAGTEQGNNRAAPGRERRFIFRAAEPLAVENGELLIRFEYRPDEQGRRQKELIADAERRINETRGFDEWIGALAAPAPTEANPQRTLLARHLYQYTARNTFDYFIHKDLGGFLRRELDFYIKNEVMHLDDIEDETAPRVEHYLGKIKAIRRIADKIITMLAQIEDFQKKLWLKKKFVIETNYCITLDRVPEEFYVEIAANDAQRDAWVRLFAIDEIHGDLTHAAYTVPLSFGFLRANPFLLLDTRHFSGHFTTALLSRIDDLDAAYDGVLVRSENFQALRLLSPRFRGQIACIYIDPPYNTGDSEILYKNEYISSSWLTLMANRIELSAPLLSEDPVLFVAIDDFEMVDLCELIDRHLSLFRREMIVVNHHPQGGKARTLANTHEYMLACVTKTSDRTLTGRTSEEGVEHRPFKRSGTAESNFRRARPNSFYAILIDPHTHEIRGIEPPPPLGVEYPTQPTESGLARAYPVGVGGAERVWRRSYESCLELIANRRLQCTVNLTVYQLIEAHDRTPALFSNWVDPRYNAGTFGANLLRDILGTQNPFSYPKSIHTVGDALFSVNLQDEDIILDYFAGSGTTGHAVINLNREDDQNRKYVLVEMGEHFDTALLPRIQRIVYSRDWRDGKPVSREGSSHTFKYLRLESFDDTLLNLRWLRRPEQQTILDENPGVREDYLLSYMLDVEAQGSASLLSVEAFEDPFAYKLNVIRGDETKAVNVDLVETFNWLIGLTVRHIDHIRGVRVVSGTNPAGERVLVLWRKLADTDNDALDEWFRRQGYNSRDMEYDLIYVNGDNNLENLRRPDHTWKVRMIEPEFKRLMFETQDA